MTKGKPREDEPIQPVRIIAGGQESWSLWFSGDVDVLLTADRRVLAFRGLDALKQQVRANPSMSPNKIYDQTVGELSLILESAAATFDLDSARAWFGSPARQIGRAQCELVLNAMNGVSDIATSVGDSELLDALASNGLGKVLDLMTESLTFLGEWIGSNSTLDSLSWMVDSAVMAAAVGCIERGVGHVYIVDGASS